MTFISVAQAARRLGIDGKTLQRWLAQAQLSVQPHPSDGRQKGLSLEQLHTLAYHHQRHLAPLFAEAPASSGTAAPALLALSEQLTALEAQLSGLRTEVAALTGFLQQHAVAPTSPTASPLPRQSPIKPVAPPRRPAGSSIAPTASRKPTHVIPRVEYAGEGRYVVICLNKGRLSLEPDTPEWFDWLRTQSSFRFVGQRGHFSSLPDTFFRIEKV